MDRSRQNNQPIELEGRRVRLRDWQDKDLASLRSQLDPARSWHDTNGPYLGRMSPEEADAMVARMAELAAKDPANLPSDGGSGSSRKAASARHDDGPAASTIPSSSACSATNGKTATHPSQQPTAHRRRPAQQAPPPVTTR